MKKSTHLGLDIQEQTDVLDIEPIANNFQILDVVVESKANKKDLPTKLSQFQDDIMAYHKGTTPTPNTKKMWLDTSK